MKPQIMEKSVVDRTIQAVLSDRTSTPTLSDSANITSSTEFLHRLHGTTLLSHASILLKTPSSVYATSTTIFHRFFHQHSLQKYDVWSTSMACTLLACKTEENNRRMKDIIFTYMHLYRRFRLGYLYKGDNSSSLLPEIVNSTNCQVKHRMNYFQTSQTCGLSGEEKQNRLRIIRPVSEVDPIYKEWESALFKMENVLLRELGFTLYFIPDNHAHGFLMYFLKVLEIDEDEVSVEKLV